MPGNEVNKWPLWQCLKPEGLTNLKILRKRFGLTVNLKTDPFREVESVEEIDKIMRELPRYGGKV